MTNWLITNSSFNKQIWLVPSMFLMNKFECIFILADQIEIHTNHKLSADRTFGAGTSNTRPAWGFNAACQLILEPKNIYYITNLLLNENDSNRNLEPKESHQLCHKCQWKKLQNSNIALLCPFNVKNVARKLIFDV
jgi:hypothetical protein